MKKESNGQMTDVKRILGMIFGAIGLGSLVVGCAVSFAIKYSGTELWFLPAVIIGPTGLVFLVLGTVFLISEKRRRALEEELKNHGRALEASVTDVRANMNMTVNGRHPYYVEAQWQEPMSGTVHVFRSRDIGFNPWEFVEGRKVKVYVSDNDYSRYYLDLESVLPKVEVH
ncbi:MAG: hypothetical protein IKI84_04815 [Clostridia bacterium]|nr:hypothetical protein [Clostridia bacterium]